MFLIIWKPFCEHCVILSWLVVSPLFCFSNAAGMVLQWPSVWSAVVELVRNMAAHGDAQEGKCGGKLANGVGSQYSHATSEHGLSSITQADAHTSAASSRLNWRPHRFKWTRPFRGKTKSGFCACAITFRTSYTYCALFCMFTKNIQNKPFETYCLFIIF